MAGSSARRRRGAPDGNAGRSSPAARRARAKFPILAVGLRAVRR